MDAKTNIIGLMKFPVKTKVFASNREFFMEKDMKIILDEVKKDGVLVKNDGTEVSRYSYKNLVNEDFTLEELKEELSRFNVTLGQQEEFDDIKELSHAVKIHSW